MSEHIITRLGHKGDGLTADGTRAPLTLPGEVIAGEISQGRIAEPKILTPSPDRVRAPCAHFRSCGGCALQHGSDAFLAGWKVQVIETALSAQGLSTRFRPIHVSPPHARRRATLAGRRTKKGALVGFHARRSDTIVPITECHVLHPDLLGLTPVLAEITRMGGSRSATLSFALTRSANGVDCAVTGGKPLDGALRLSLPKFLPHFARLSWDEDTIFATNPPVQRFGSIAVTPPPGVFLQATPDGEAALVSAVTEAVGEARKIVDLFAGCGTFTLPLAQNAALHAVEGAPDMTAALDHAIRHANGLKPVTIETRDLYRRPLLPDELARTDAIILDPPRAGAEAQVAQIATARVPSIAYVSCNPVSFARDAKSLAAAGYRLNWVQPVDQFRWSAHIELAAGFTLH
jgi:23S rRNA (uracil1939-C5)-methyltransferase